MSETVLVTGASGNIGVAAIIGALQANRRVIAVVRSQASAEKIFDYVGSRDGITIVEADVTSEESIRGVVDLAQAGKLPSFQHVWVSAGGVYWDTPILELDLDALREAMKINFESYIAAYRATIPYLLEQGFENSTWSMCTGAQGEVGTRVAPAVSQGALYSFALAAARENEKTNVRFNEVYLVYRVQLEIDGVAEAFKEYHISTSRDFAPLYQNLLDRTDIRSRRVNAFTPKDVHDLKYETRYDDSLGKKKPEDE
ncbi:hypothetical protein Cob_v011393 [Colletotrichum orbiculare MAFF 240422]|uniref:Uncharacterized protein n=1 Tax=Colletotrichum orbiculare (strain 104-T / ATCC 96160 / CBS 514.97 / LARS 414 / MAFF 240422) TaxID=1213857 RepID=N4UND0_COLOR|nr:hypothetical protein Cob_v011393 [Colletotrichum orbiculare MAFF 240422]